MSDTAVSAAAPPAVAKLSTLDRFLPVWIGVAMAGRWHAKTGVDITGHQPTQLAHSLIQPADLVVVLGTEAQLDPTVTTPVETWETDEPSGHGIDGVERMRLVRDDIANRVQALITKFLPDDTKPQPE